MASSGGCWWDKKASFEEIKYQARKSMKYVPQRPPSFVYCVGEYEKRPAARDLSHTIVLELSTESYMSRQRNGQWACTASICNTFKTDTKHIMNYRKKENGWCYNEECWAVNISKYTRAIDSIECFSYTLTAQCFSTNSFLLGLSTACIPCLHKSSSTSFSSLIDPAIETAFRGRELQAGRNLAHQNHATKRLDDVSSLQPSLSPSIESCTFEAGFLILSRTPRFFFFFIWQSLCVGRKFGGRDRIAMRRRRLPSNNKNIFILMYWSQYFTAGICSSHRYLARFLSILWNTG